MRYVTVLALLTATDVVAAAPPPPVGPGPSIEVDGLSRLATQKDTTEYLQHFDEGVVIFLDHDQAVKGIGNLKTLIGQWNALGYQFTPVSIAYGGDERMVLERVTTLPKAGVIGAVYDCCYWYRTVKYTFNVKSKIEQIDIMTARRASFYRLPQ